MAIIKWHPWLDPFDEMDKLFGEGISAITQKNFTPAVDLYQDKDKIVVEIPLAGIDPDKVNISIENDVLIVSGSTEKKTEVDEKDYYRREIRKGSFYRSVALPTRVLGEKADASYENGILKINVPKTAEVKPKTIKVKKIKKVKSKK